MEAMSFILVYEMYHIFSKNNSIVGAMDCVVSQSVSEVCLYVTPIWFELLSEPMKLQFIKGK